ncbi:MAG: amidohydrolase family protein, partial [Hymenobacteraceae bacterium]|nr:amidohydrolase family protein [Hymenobacteraceae bacterium]
WGWWAPVTADIAAHQLAFTDEEMPAFETSFKVRPPFRTAADRAALLDGLADGTIDAVTSAHQPHDPESKELEFDLAEFGATGLETAFAALRTHAPEVNLDTLLATLTTGPRAVLGWPATCLAVGEPARLTLFDPTAEWTPTPANTASKARNSPFFGHLLRGQVVGILTETGLTTWSD